MQFNAKKNLSPKRTLKKSLRIARKDFFVKVLLVTFLSRKVRFYLVNLL